MLELYKENSVQEPLNDRCIHDHEVAEILGVSAAEVLRLRESWVTRFVEANGLRVLVKILEKMANIARSTPKGDLLRAKIEKDCWNQVLKIIKVLLMSSFVAKLPSPELSLDLQRRMSSVAEEEEKTDEKTEAAKSVVPP